MGLRESINQKPWLGWVMAGIILVGAIVMYMRLSGGSSSDFSSDRATDMITILYTDDQSTQELPRGRVLQQLMDRGASVDPNQGLKNPKTGAMTGFPIDKDGWNRMVEAVNKTNEDLKKARESGQQPK